MALAKSTEGTSDFSSALARALCLAFALLGLLLAVLPIAGDLEQRFGLQWLFSLRGIKAAPPDVVILAINSETTDALNLPEKPLQWSRALHSQALSRLTEAGAAAVVFDLFFEESRTEDADFAAAISRANNVVLAKKLVAQSEAQQTATPLLRQAAQRNATFVLPREPLRVDGYWTFKSDDGDLATMPVAALEVFARSAFAPLQNIMTGVGAALDADLQASPSVNDGAKTSATRRALRSDPTLLARVLHQIDGNQKWTPREKHLLRALATTLGGDSARFLNFYGPPRTITTVPYHHVTGSEHAHADPTLFKNKTVFIGYLPTQWRDYEAVRDDYPTVYSQADGLRLSGVEIAATAFANLLDGSDIKPLATPRQMALFGLWGGAAGLLAGLLSMRRAGIALALASVVYLLCARHAFAQHNLWLPLLVPLIILSPLAYVSAALLKYRLARRERNRVVDLAKQFVPADVLRRSLADSAPAGPQTQLAYGVCLATDVKNYTRLSETLAPQALANLMNDYFSMLNQLVEQHGGIIADMRGDALLALWAGTAGSADLRRQACRAALAMNDAIEQFNRDPARQKLETRIGLHAGEVAVGTLGARGGHLEFRAVGDIVNTASRVEGLNKILNTSVLATQEVVDAIDDIFVRPLGRFQLSGKSQALEIVELIANEKPKTLDENHAAFATATNLYRQGNLNQAITQFENLAQRWNNDGPTQFYVALCRHRLSEINQGAWDPTIAIDQK